MATVRYVNTASSAGGDGTTNATAGATRAYATLREAADALGASLGDQVTIYCSGSAADTSNTDQSAWDMATTTTNYLRIVGEQSPNHPNFTTVDAGKWSTSKYRIEATNRNGLYNNIPAHLRLEGLQIQVTINDGTSYVILKTANANITTGDADLRCGYTIVRGVLTSGSLIGCESRPFGVGGAGTSKFYNCIAYDCTTGFNGEFVTTEFYNCTGYDNQFSFLANDTNGALCRNCVAAGTSDQYFLAGGTFHANSRNNASPDGSHPGTNGQTGTPTFVNAAADDFHLQVGDAVCRNTGMTDPASGLFSDDIDGGTRSGSWDIGVDEQGVALIVAVPALPGVLRGARRSRFAQKRRLVG